MSKDEALNLALQALETLMIERGSIYDKAITAIKEALMSHSDGAQPEPEYLAFMDTPQRKPLTDEEIRDLWSWSATAEAERTATTQQHAFARAIEAAHGIKGEA